MKLLLLFLFYTDQICCKLSYLIVYLYILFLQNFTVSDKQEELEAKHWIRIQKDKKKQSKAHYDNKYVITV